ncbi:hypothetical protein MSIM_13800 [Mycobacterium simiae]|nr:hypothetical protein MSIM_13800 [Mycobacterium simiae]
MFSRQSGGYQRGFVTGRASTEDHDAGHHVTNLAKGHGERADEYRMDVRRLSFLRAALRRLRIEHASRADAAARTALPDGGNGLVARVAADLRR